MRGGVVDHDPMEGLPVRRWEMMDVTIKQDAKDEGKEEGRKEGVNPNWPWPDLPLPKDFHLLPAHSQVHLTDYSYPISISAVAHFLQELLRRARAPNKNPNVAVFNRETGEYERPNLNPHNPAAMTPVNKVPNFRDSTTVATPAGKNDPKATKNDAAAEPEDDLDTEKPAPEVSHQRTITLKRWAPLPQSVADKKPEPKYLADRRPGLPPLYGHQAAANTSSSATKGYTPNISSTLTNNGDVIVGSVNAPTDRVANASGYRVSADGTTMPIGPGIAGATPGVDGQGQAEAKRKALPPPPKRRKKGGSARSKRRVETVDPAVRGRAGNGGPAAGVNAQKGNVVGEEGAAQIASADTRVQEDETGAGGDVLMAEVEDVGSSGSEDEEGSEEGEVDEGKIVSETAPATAPAATDTATTATAATAAAEESGATAPDVSVQPPSPDLLGNLESEIEGMEEEAPAT